MEFVISFWILGLTFWRQLVDCFPNMKKEELIGKRVAIWSKDYFVNFKGRTGEIVKVKDKTEYGYGFVVEFDKFDKIFLFEDELYFPNSPLGYNQKCFQ